MQNKNISGCGTYKPSHMYKLMMAALNSSAPTCYMEGSSLMNGNGNGNGAVLEGLWPGSSPSVRYCSFVRYVCLLWALPTPLTDLTLTSHIFEWGRMPVQNEVFATTVQWVFSQSAYFMSCVWNFAIALSVMEIYILDVWWSWNGYRLRLCSFFNWKWTHRWHLNGTRLSFKGMLALNSHLNYDAQRWGFETDRVQAQ